MGSCAGFGTHVLCRFFLYPLPSLGLTFFTSKLGIERKLLSSFLYAPLGSYFPEACLETTSLPQVPRKGPLSRDYLVGEGVILALLGR